MIKSIDRINNKRFFPIRTFKTNKPGKRRDLSPSSDSTDNCSSSEFALAKCSGNSQTLILPNDNKKKRNIATLIDRSYI